MKKLFSIIAAFLLMFTFVACDATTQTPNTELEARIAQLESTISDLEDANEALAGDKNDLVAQVASLTADLATANSTISTKTADLTALQTEKATLESEKAALEAQVATLQGEKTALETQVADLQAQITAKDLEIAAKDAEIAAQAEHILALIEAALIAERASLDSAMAFDNIIVITVEQEERLVRFVGYNDDFTGTFFDLLDENFYFNASSSEYGHMINEIEDLQPLNGQYISFLVNGEMSWVGVDAVELNHGDIYSFELAWWDMTEKAAYDQVQLYLENYAADAVNATTIDYVVATALAHYGTLEDYVSDLEVQAYIDGLTLTTWNDYVKAIIIMEAADLDATSLYNGLNSIAAPAGYGATGYQLNTFAANNTTVDYSVFQTAALTDLNTNTPEALGVDSGAICVMALSYYTSENGVDTLINDWVSYIKTNQTEDGKILDKDFGWGQSESAATMAQAIMGLVAIDVNPKGDDATGTDMTQLNYDLIAALAGMADETGAYAGWDGNPDLTFSTPQAFLALVVYLSYSNQEMPINAYQFDYV